MQAKKLIFDGLDIVKQRGQNPKIRKEEEIRMEVQVTEDQQEGDKKMEGILRKTLALDTKSLDGVDSGEDDGSDASMRDD